MNLIPASAESAIRAAHIIQEGGVVAHATETCYGFACDLSNIDAVKRLFTLKKRDTTKPVSALFPDIYTAKPYVQWNTTIEEYATKYLPGPYTLVVCISPDAPLQLHACPVGSDTIGIRISSSTIARDIAIHARMPISTTSANSAGGNNCYSAADILAQFPNGSPQPDLIIDSGELPHIPSSSVIDLTGISPRTLR